MFVLNDMPDGVIVSIVSGVAPGQARIDIPIELTMLLSAGLTEIFFEDTMVLQYNPPALMIVGANLTMNVAMQYIESVNWSIDDELTVTISGTMMILRKA